MFGVAMGGCSCHCESLYFTVKAFNPDGTERWRHDQFPDGGNSYALLLSENSAYVIGVGAGQLQLLSSVDGDDPEVEWSSTGDTTSYPATATDPTEHNRLILADDSHLWALALAGGFYRLMRWNESGEQVGGVTSAGFVYSPFLRLGTFDSGDTAGVAYFVVDGTANFANGRVARHDRAMAIVDSGQPIPSPLFPRVARSWLYFSTAGDQWIIYEFRTTPFSNVYSLDTVMLDGQTLAETARHSVNAPFFQSPGPNAGGDSFNEMVVSDDGSTCFLIDLYDNLVKMSLPGMTEEWSVPKSVHQLKNLWLVDENGDLYGSRTGEFGLQSTVMFFDVAKVDGATGDPLWYQPVVPGFAKRFWGLRKCGSDVVVFGEWKENPSDNFNRHVAKLASSDGSIEWQQSYTTADRLISSHDVWDVRCGSDGSVYACGNRFKGGDPDTTP